MDAEEFALRYGYCSMVCRSRCSGEGVNGVWLRAGRICGRYGRISNKSQSRRDVLETRVKGLGNYISSRYLALS